MARIDPDVVERIRNGVDIVELISGYVQLKRSGRQLSGLCPFHQEKTPSFYVSPEKGFFKCFGCGAAGSVFDFVMQKDGVSFSEACEILAERVGIPVDAVAPRRAARGDRGSSSGTTKSDIYRVNAWAARFFVQQFDAAAGASCRAYVEGRGIDAAARDRFQLGYALPGWDTLVRAAQREGFPEALLLAAGLVKRREGGGAYDVFRNRLVFPIRDHLERVIGFGGRALAPDDKPKYLNTPETPVFSKRRCLYAAEYLKKLEDGAPVLVMEGYTDVVMAAQHGCNNAVATLGTSLTPEHARILARFTDRVILVFDGDAAGERAAKRGADVFASVDVDLAVSRLPAGKDPCDLFANMGAAAAREITTGAVDYFEFILADCKSRFDLASTGGRVRAADALLDVARPIDNPVKRGLALDRIAAELRIGRNELEQRFKRRAHHRRFDEAADASSALEPERAGSGRRATETAERTLLADYLHRAGHVEWEAIAERIEWANACHHRLWRTMLARRRDGADLGAESLLLVEEDAEVRRLIFRLIEEAEDSDRLRAKADGAVEYLERLRLERAARSAATQLQNAGESADEVLKRFQEHQRRLKVPQARKMREPRAEIREEEDF